MPKQKGLMNSIKSYLLIKLGDILNLLKTILFQQLKKTNTEAILFK